MRIYVRDIIIAAPSPTENIIALSELRRKYGEVGFDGRGSYFDLPDNETVFGLPASSLANALHQEVE